MLKDPLEYTEDELNSLSTEDLKILYNKSETKESLFDTRQLTEKTMMNSFN